MLRPASLLALAPLAALALIDDTPRLAYDEGSEVTRSWSVDITRSINEATLGINGDGRDIGSDSTRSATIEIQVIDRVEGVADGAPTLFVRSYESIDTNTEIDGLEESEGMEVRSDDGASALAGSDVRFEYDADAEEWSRSFDEDSSGDDEWLDALDPDMDLAMILPDDEVEVGDGWEVPVAVVDALLLPGGELDVDEGGDDAPEEGAISIVVPNAGDIGRWSELDGSVDATLSEIVDEDGRRLARIELAIDVEGEIDITDDLDEKAEARGASETYSDATIERTLEGKVKVDWDLEAGRFATVEGELVGTANLFTSSIIATSGIELEIEVESDEEIVVEISATQG